jgi:hypothetical protein
VGRAGQVSRPPRERWPRLGLRSQRGEYEECFSGHGPVCHAYNIVESKILVEEPGDAREASATPPAASTVTLTNWTKAGAAVPREPGPEMQPTKIGRGQGKYYDPFYAFEQIARYHGEPPPPKPKKGALRAIEMLTSKTAVVVMSCVLAVVVFGLLLILLLGR